MSSGSAAYFPCFRTPSCRQAAGHNGTCTGPLMADARARVSGCGTPGCTSIPRAHHGICTVPTPEGTRVHLSPGQRRAERDVKQGVKRGPYGPGEFTPYRAKPGARTVGLRGLIAAACTSPLGAAFGLFLLSFLWLSGCA